MPIGGLGASWAVNLGRRGGRTACRRERLSVGRKLAEPVRPARDGVPVVQVSTHGDRQPGTRAAARLWRNLQHPPGDRDGIVAADHALFFVTENEIKIDGRPEGHEGTGRIPWGAGERGVVLRHEPLGEIAVGGLARGDPGDPQLVDEPILERAIEAFTPSPRLRRIRRDVFHAQAGQGAADLRQPVFINRSLRLRGMKRPVRAAV